MAAVLVLILIVLHVLALPVIAVLAIDDARHAARTARPGHLPASTISVRA